MPKKSLSKSRKINNKYPTKKFYHFSIFWLLLVLGLFYVGLMIYGAISNQKQRRQDQIEKQVYSTFKTDFNKLTVSFSKIDPLVKWSENAEGSCEWASGIGLEPGYWICSLSASAFFSDEKINQAIYMHQLFSVMQKYEKEFKSYSDTNDSSERRYQYRSVDGSICHLFLADSRGYVRNTSEASRVLFECSSSYVHPSKSWYKSEGSTPYNAGENAWREDNT